jgi:hypothetical protein
VTKDYIFWLALMGAIALFWFAYWLAGLCQ